MLTFMTRARFRRITPDAGSSLIIPITNPNRWLHLPVLIYWLMGWTFGELAAVNELNRQGFKNGDKLFLVWAVVWTAGGVYALLDLLWQLWGRQELTVASTSLIHRHGLLGLSLSRRYKPAHMHNIRVIALEQYNSAIAFDYDGQAVRLGLDVGEREAKQIVNVIQKISAIPQTKLSTDSFVS